ncbi:MAG TPA: sigma factor-like helix-turn-helix DNA-binding protein [Acidimicrobiales bacterium]|nr:sigma factor-like helix-turn-helix DNA-binding protein [Acidimicrobiales bacterium]
MTTHLTQPVRSAQLPPELPIGELERRMAFLDERERAVLCLHLGLDGCSPHHISEVAHLVHVARSRARIIEARAISKLQHPSLGGPWAA